MRTLIMCSSRMALAASHAMPRSQWIVWRTRGMPVRVVCCWGEGGGAGSRVSVSDQNAMVRPFHPEYKIQTCAHTPFTRMISCALEPRILLA
jgi:hypothetical protein